MCISSCKDYQRTWEVPGGLSLTQVRINEAIQSCRLAYRSSSTDFDKEVQCVSPVSFKSTYLDWQSWLGNDPYPLLADLMFHVKFVHFSPTSFNKIKVNLRCENFKNFGKVFEKVQKYFEEFQSWQEVCKKRKRTIPRRDSMWLPTKLRQDPQVCTLCHATVFHLTACLSYLKLSSPEPLVSISS